MRATKKKAEVLYNALKRHFHVDEFTVYWPSFEHKMRICATKNGHLMCLESPCLSSIELKWATKYIYRCCFDWEKHLPHMVISLEEFAYYLSECSFDFMHGKKGLLDIKHEVVKQLVKSLRIYGNIWVMSGALAPSAPDLDYHVNKPDSLEELVIQEELGQMPC